MRVIAFFMAAALLLAGCAEDKPREPKASAAPTVTVPTMPAAAEKDSEAGAIAFVKHYIDVFNYACNTGDVKELQKLSDPKCEGCNSYIELYAGTYAAGGFYRDANWVLTNLEVRTEGEYSLVLASLTAPAGSYKSSAEDSVHKGNSEETRLAFLPIRSSEGWTINTFERQGD